MSAAVSGGGALHEGGAARVIGRFSRQLDSSRVSVRRVTSDRGAAP